MQSKWKEEKFEDELELRAYSSRLIGSVPELVLHGGGNTSIKLEEKDHAGRNVRVLRVKGSGTDLAVVTREGFTGLRLEDLELARAFDKMEDVEMVEFFRKSMVDPEESPPSVESFLHAFIPFRFVDHSHADSILSLTNTDLPDSAIREALGKVVIIPYVSPGFKLAKAILSHIDELKDSDGLVLRKHGLFTFSDSARDAYEKHISIVNRAEEYIERHLSGPLFEKKFEDLQLEEKSFLPRLRGIVSRHLKKVLNVENSGIAKEIADSDLAENLCRLGPPTSDMLIRTKSEFLYVPDTQDIEKVIEGYVEKYRKEHAAYAAAYPMHDPFPSVIMVRGYGIITQGVSEEEARIIMDQAIHSFLVNARSGRIGRNSPLSKEEAYAMEYWPLQEAKLKKPRRKLEGTVSIVTGAASGIGLEAFRTLASNGSHVVAIDIDSRLGDISGEVRERTGACNLPLVIDLSDEAALDNAFSSIVHRFGGVDVLFNNAGILKTAPLDRITSDEMDRVYAVNGRGTFLITRDAFRIMKTQGIGGNFVFNITKNLTNPGPEMAMYGSTKAFAAHISHYVAKEGGKYGIRSNIINPDKVFRGSKIWEGGILESRARAKGQTEEEYKTQNLLGVEVLPSHVVGVLMALLDENSFGATTDAMIPVDGGIK